MRYTLKNLPGFSEGEKLLIAAGAALIMFCAMSVGGCIDAWLPSICLGFPLAWYVLPIFEDHSRG